jgi:hexosaminidase
MQTTDIVLCPQPKIIQWAQGHYRLPDAPLRLFYQPTDDQPTPDAAPYVAFIQRHTAASVAQGQLDAYDVLLRHVHSSAQDMHRLKISTHTIEIHAGGPAALFLGVCTLAQIMQQSGDALPCVTIEDWPDLPIRGYMLDISRNKVPTLQTLYGLVDLLASLKYNHLQLYTEHTFAYEGHEQVWRDASPLTADEIRELDAYCRENFIDLVPNQNSLGHMERWLKHERYRPLAECEDGYTDPIGRQRGASTLNPLDPASFDLVSGLYDQLLPNFSSKTVNIGCDEPWELGQCKSKDALAQRGGRVYLDWVLKLHADLKRRGMAQVQFWGDIIIKYPDLIADLPPDLVVMEWGYEATHPFDERAAHYAAAGVPFYVCPGTSSWNSFTGRTPNALSNIRNAADYGRWHGAAGFLLTDWGDNGHLQALPVSYLPIVAGAARAWHVAYGPDIYALADRFVFRDEAGVMGRVVADLGNIYREIGPEHINGSILALAAITPAADLARRLDYLLKQVAPDKPADYSPQNLRRLWSQINGLLAKMQAAQMQRPDADLILAEFTQMGHLLQLGIIRLLRWQGEDLEPLIPHDMLLQLQQQQWLARNRPGGLADSLQILRR